MLLSFSDQSFHFTLTGYSTRVELKTVFDERLLHFCFAFLNRVKQAIAKKEETMKTLREQHQVRSQVVSNYVCGKFPLVFVTLLKNDS